MINNTSFHSGEISLTKKQINARRVFESQVNQAKHCRKKHKLTSCFQCPEYFKCDIQKRVDQSLKNL